MKNFYALQKKVYETGAKLDVSPVRYTSICIQIQFGVDIDFESCSYFHQGSGHGPNFVRYLDLDPAQIMKGFRIQFGSLLLFFIDSYTSSDVHV